MIVTIERQSMRIKLSSRVTVLYRRLRDEWHCNDKVTYYGVRPVLTDQQVTQIIASENIQPALNIGYSEDLDDVWFDQWMQEAYITWDTIKKQQYSGSK